MAPELTPLPKAPLAQTKLPHLGMQVTAARDSIRSLPHPIAMVMVTVGNAGWGSGGLVGLEVSVIRAPALGRRLWADCDTSRTRSGGRGDDAEEG